MPDIPDPRMNPNGERAFGTVIHDKDGHHYVYIKTVNDDDIEKSSRYFTGSSQVEVGNVYPAFLVVPTLEEEEIVAYQNLDFDEKHALITKLNNIAGELKKCIKQCSNIPVEVKVVNGFDDKPVIFDLIEIKGLAPAVDQKIIKELNKEAKRLLKN